MPIPRFCITFSTLADSPVALVELTKIWPDKNLFIGHEELESHHPLGELIGIP